MAIKKRTFVHTIEIDPQTGAIGLRLAKIVFEDGEPLGEPGWHRAWVAPTQSVAEAVMAVNSHLAQLKWPEIEPADLSIVESVKAWVVEGHATLAARAAAWSAAQALESSAKTARAR
jgi:hypothetical protein